jgi:hypothetical protein
MKEQCTTIAETAGMIATNFVNFLIDHPSGYNHQKAPTDFMSIHVSDVPPAEAMALDPAVNVGESKSIDLPFFSNEMNAQKIHQNNTSV